MGSLLSAPAISVTSDGGMGEAKPEAPSAFGVLQGQGACKPTTDDAANILKQFQMSKLLDGDAPKVCECFNNPDDLMLISHYIVECS